MKSRRTSLIVAAVLYPTVSLHAARATVQLVDVTTFQKAVETCTDAAPLPIFPAVLGAFRVLDTNGDLDGFPDTNESVDLEVAVHNPTRAQHLTNVLVRITTTDPKIDCISTSEASIPTLPAGGVTDVSFRFHVHPDVERSGPRVVCRNPGPTGACSNFVSIPEGCYADADCYRAIGQDYAARINVTISSDQMPSYPRPDQTIDLELDVDSSNPGGVTATFVEGYESGSVNLVPQDLDDGKASNALSNGYRCQYNDPDYPGSNSYGATECYLGFPLGQDPINAWHIHDTTAPDGGRAFAGQRSLHYGLHTPGYPDLDTYGLRQLDAIRTKSNINLAARVCRDDPAANKRPCTSTTDCVVVGGGPCVSANPELCFKQQVSLMDDRVLGPDGQSVDRAVVQVQPGSSALWIKVSPFENIYDIVSTDHYSNCIFDPIDDGNDEDSYFAPTDPQRRLGPSSTCFPEFVLAYLGDTDALFNPIEIGRASDGPGLPGSIGAGTWVESRFDLSAFRGRSVKLRFLLTSFGIGDHQTWASVYGAQRYPWDDGWYIDDVRVTETTGGTAPTATADAADNASLPGNADLDARGDPCDCAPFDPDAFAVPGEIRGLSFDAEKTRFLWQSAAPAAGIGTVHDVLRGVLTELPVGAGTSEVCIESGIPGASADDPTTPGSGTGFWYLVRGRNACAVGTYGFRGDGGERVSAACP